MTDYTKLVEDLRDIEKTMFALGTSPTNMNNVSINLAYDKKWGYTAADAAAAIEALQAEVPKRGEWKPIYYDNKPLLVECSNCGAQLLGKVPHCPYCGANMEVQE